MKRIICGLLALALAVGVLGGCSQKDGESSSVPEVSAAPVEQKEQEPYRIGVVQYQDYGPMDEAREAFMSRLDEWGLDDGEMEIDYQNAGGSQEKAEEICEKFASDKADVIVAVSSPAAKAAVKAAGTSGTKVVFLGVRDTKADLGLENPAQPEGNATGVEEPSCAQAALELARQVDPGLTAAGLLYDPSCPFGAAYVKEFKEYCAQNEITVLEGQVTASSEAAARMSELCAQAGAVFSPVDSTVAAAAKDVAKAASDAGKPWYASTQDLVRQGALACVSMDYAEAGRHAADMAVQLAAGRPASELPVYSFGSGQVSVNQEVMAALSAEIPEEVLSTAIYVQPQAGEN